MAEKEPTPAPTEAPKKSPAPEQPTAEDLAGSIAGFGGAFKEISLNVSKTESTKVDGKFMSVGINAGSVLAVVEDSDTDMLADLQLAWLEARVKIALERGVAELRELEASKPAPVAVPVGAPAPAGAPAQAPQGAVSGKQAFDVDGTWVMTPARTTGGEPVMNFKWGRFVKYGIPCYKEVANAILPEGWESWPIKDYAVEGFSTVFAQMKADGNPAKITGVE